MPRGQPNPPHPASRATIDRGLRWAGVSEENVEICRRAFDAFGTRREVEVGLAYVDPEVELRSAIVSGAEGSAFHGHKGVRAWMAESIATWEDMRLEAEEFRDLGDTVLMIGRLYARGRTSGVEIESPIAWLTTLRAGKIIESRGFLDPEEALRAAGLSA